VFEEGPVLDRLNQLLAEHDLPMVSREKMAAGLDEEIPF